ncbi:hypothetical protein [Desertibacillus haloalkaliphilus]|uniref:hypothetical protein n=1 Tax=Desertibacillus haloalkaliphilus TaxID=1328930 RepID=UPI001C26057F|nr:hypothetical protein [Desertibacillus haloalkaliphilus]MBU8908077.1 hypothetical protein [Desertibacillus haloalkaliphilus]
MSTNNGAIENETTVNSRLHECTKKMMAHFNDDRKFISDFIKTMNFYLEQFYTKIQGRPNRKAFEESFSMYIQDITFNGYYIGKEILDKAESVPEEALTIPTGQLKNVVYDDVKVNTNNNIVNLITSEELQEIEGNFKNEYENIGNLLDQVKIDFAIYGAVQAYIDYREEKGLFIVPEKKSTIKGFIYRVDDLLFVDPQKFIACTMANQNSETWEMFHWRTLGMNEKIGSVHLYIYSKDEVQEITDVLAVYHGGDHKKAEDKVVIHIQLREGMREQEMSSIADKIVQSFLERNEYLQSQVEVSIATVKNWYEYSMEE